MFIVYLTIYSGDKLPPFYIGSTSLEKHLNGYHGTILSKAYRKIYNKELLENPTLFDSCILSEHPTREEALKVEKDYQIRVQAHKNPLYMNMSLASPTGFFGRDVSGKNHPLYGSHNAKNNIHSYNPETLEQTFAPTIPEGFIKGRSPKYKASGHNKGKIWYTNGTSRKMFHEGSQPLGWEKGTFNSEEQKNKISNSLKNLDSEKKARISAAVSKARRGPAYEHFDELFALWMECGKISPNKFRKIAVDKGFPDISYHNIIYSKFKGM
ncbi:hypothetical protein [Escherichia phage AV109]|nr:hypothetical protein [Escherichia phage AV109]WPK35068.1 hypothetical protein [Escherichia phage AV114]WPK35584.1 hypothetical protein [Escherichia phage AV116]WPK36114.1 hypothetical protein [Escherichia phage AV118]